MTSFLRICADCVCRFLWTWVCYSLMQYFEKTTDTGTVHEVSLMSFQGFEVKRRENVKKRGLVLENL